MKPLDQNRRLAAMLAGVVLTMGALAWAFGGWKIWVWYLDFLGPVWGP